jgi:hypothetical protein
MMIKNITIIDLAGWSVFAGDSRFEKCLQKASNCFLKVIHTHTHTHTHTLTRTHSLTHENVWQALALSANYQKI